MKEKLIRNGSEYEEIYKNFLCFFVIFVKIVYNNCMKWPLKILIIPYNNLKFHKMSNPEEKKRIFKKFENFSIIFTV